MQYGILLVHVHYGSNIWLSNVWRLDQVSVHSKHARRICCFKNCNLDNSMIWVLVIIHKIVSLTTSKSNWVMTFSITNSGFEHNDKVCHHNNARGSECRGTLSESFDGISFCLYPHKNSASRINIGRCIELSILWLEFYTTTLCLYSIAKQKILIHSKQSGAGSVMALMGSLLAMLVVSD